LEYQRETVGEDGRRTLRRPSAWRRQRFCSIACVKQYRLQGPQAWRGTALPGYLQSLEPVKPVDERFELPGYLACLEPRL
jgi:hypothetical protein